MTDDLTIGRAELWKSGAMGPHDFDFRALPFPLSLADKELCYRRFHEDYCCRLNRRLSMKQAKEIEEEITVEPGKPIHDAVAVIRFKDMPSGTREILREELTDLLFDKAENPGPPFYYYYDLFAELIRQWGSKESGEEGLKNLDKLHARERKGALARQGLAEETVTRDHPLFREWLIVQLKPLMKQVHARLNQCRELDRSVIYGKIRPFMESEIKKNPDCFSTVSSEPNFTDLMDFLELEASKGFFTATCGLSVTDFVDKWLAFSVGYPEDPAGSKASTDRVRKWKYRRLSKKTT